MAESFSLNYFIHDSSFPFFIQKGHHDGDLYMHSHIDYTELVIVLHGTAIHKVGNESYFIKKGDVFVINDGVIHGYESPDDFKIINVMYQPGLLNGFHSDLKKLPGFHALFMLEPYFSKETDFKSRLKLELAEFDEVNILLKKMLSEYDCKQNGWVDMVSSYFTELVIMLSRLYLKKDAEDMNRIIQIAKSLSYIESNFTRPITIEELAKQSLVSVRHFNRVFKEAYHTTPGNYLLHLRLEYACILLKKTKDSITDISLHSGFSSSNYFTRQFKKHYLITPREYRNQYQ